jgi:hypothetical protein
MSFLNVIPVANNPWNYIDFNPLTNQLHAAVFLEELIVTQLVKKFPAFYGTQRFITVFTRPDYCTLY